MNPKDSSNRIEKMGRIHKMGVSYDTRTVLGAKKESFRLLMKRHFFASHDEGKEVFVDMVALIKQSEYELTKEEYIAFREHTSRVLIRIGNEYVWEF